MAAIKQVLAATAGPELVGRVEELLLATTDAAIVQVRDGDSALALARRRPFELVLTEFPLPELDLAVFLERLREPSSRSRASPVIVLAGSLAREELQALGANRLAGVDICCNSRETLRAVTRGLRLSDRRDASLTVTFEGFTESFCGRQLGRTRNISPSGMLLGVEHLLPVGMVTPISIELSREEPLIHGSAEVVRHADPLQEELIGMGMRFLRLFADGGERLAEFLHQTETGDLVRPSAGVG